MLTRSEIATATRTKLRRFGVRDVTGTIMVNAINAGCRRLNRDTGFNRGTVAISLSSGVNEYKLSGGMMPVFSVEYNGVPLDDAVSRAAMNRDYYGWQKDASGTPARYFMEGMYITVHPKPTATAATYPLMTRCVKSVTELTTASATPSWLPDDYVDGVVAASACEVLEGINADSDGAAQRTQLLYNDYMNISKQIKILVNGRNPSKSGTIVPKGYNYGRSDT